MRRQGKLIRELVFLPTHWWQMWVGEDIPLQAEKWKYGPHPQQYALFYQPEGAGFTQKPLVVFFHGGAWQFGRPEFFRAQARFFLRQGFAVVLPSYRKLPAHNFKHMLSDLELLNDFIIRVFSNQQWETAQIIAGGMSAGGHLAAHLALNPGLQSIKTAGLFTCGAPLDLHQLDNSLTRRRLAGAPGTTLFNLANPIEYLKVQPSFPTFFIHGNRDGIVPIQCTVSFVEKLRHLAHPNPNFHIIPRGSHLDAGRWAYQQDEPHQKLVSWLNQWQ